VPKSRVYRLIRRGEVRVNGSRARPDRRLADGDKVRIPPVRVAARREPERPPDATLAALQSAIVFEDRKILVIDKPAGIAVHGGSGLSWGVIEALRALRPNAPFLELAHRIDRDTSGCLIVAKRRSKLRALHALFRDGDVEKQYLVLVRGHWPHGKKSFSLPLEKAATSGGERVVRVGENGRESVTFFAPVEIFRRASFMEATIVTGRTHQIRVTAAHIDAPVGGDEKYGDRVFNAWLRQLGMKQMFLHAHRIAFSWPDTGQQVDVSAPLPPTLAGVLDRLRDAK